MAGIKSCLNCEKRAVGCHSTCEAYRAERAELDTQKSNIRKGKSEENEFYDMKVAEIRRRIKKYGR